ncbi:radical SAM protein [Methanobrevibacter thaueri]|uniref:Coproporphyrinogen III oxidase n=1 Tax=Methanobrevibacter thaueri TaxID=190975 RepID=A0A315XPF8_9EURY|nr:radical SAM protein [Methanobrevibacter thaueri]PWB88030.1 coproporphyrinogen III oxidase [Methanobrevibacter thaueri]
MLCEKNIFKKDYKQVDLRFALAYPNVYRTAMSSLGYTILYNCINEREDTWCERIIFPSTNSIESNTPSKYFDILSFSLQFEEDYFNLLKMLKDAQIPLKRSERGDEDPLIIAGGPCATANPMPLSDYIDIFIIGEGENVINELIDVYLSNPDKGLEKFLKVDGVYIPEFDNETKIAIIEDLNETYHVTYPIVSEGDVADDMSVFNNSIMLNVSRGCTRGCRFCMAGYLYRPMRQCDHRKLIDIALENRKNSGLNKVTLIGAAVSDYSNLDDLIDGLESEGFQISTPSLRIESITRNTLETLKKSGLKTITLAPESTSNLRKVINKHILEEQIFTVIKNAIDLDFNIKLYFLIGIPGESMEDIHDLCEYMKKIAEMHYNPKKVKFSVNPVIPKPHTPLQWEGYDFKDVKKKTRYIQKEMKNYNIKCESPKKGLIQYTLSCGNRQVGAIIEKSLTKNVILKEWRDIAPKYEIDDPLPWDNIDTGVNKKFLKIEHKRLKNLKQTPWCETGPCYNCGACEK